ncbi:complement component C6 [Gastrophryne carolinensis]
MDWKVSFLGLLISCLVGKASSCFCERYPWNPWSACSRTCGGGTQIRFRNINYDDYYYKNNCDNMCKKQESRSCNEQLCNVVNCLLGDYGPWSDCDPCLKKQYRLRSVARPAQFGGEGCTGQLSESRECSPTTHCKMEEEDCKKKFRCQVSGRCIESKWRCNGDDDCGNNSDESGCPNKPKGRVYQNVPGYQIIHNGYNYLSGEARGEVFDFAFYGGTNNIIRGNATGAYHSLYRLPYNVEQFTFEFKDVEDDITDADFYPTMNDFNHDVQNKGSGQYSSQGSSGIPLLFHAKSNSKRTTSSSFKEAIKSSQKKDSKFIRIHKAISVAEFRMRKEKLWLSNVFMDALKKLPLEYNYALYSRIFDDFGTHYISQGSLGGLYDLLYQYSAEELKNSGLTETESVDCLRTEIKRRIFFFFTRTEVKEKCTTNKMSDKYEGSFIQSSEKSISFVKGGRAEYAARLGYIKGGSKPDNKDYTNWKKSVTENPDIVDFQLQPITDLIYGFPCALTKRRNLVKAFNDYTRKFDPCQCLPCPNNARTVLVDTECLCVCQPGTYGESCEKRTDDYKAVAVDGSWNCWSSWSSCSATLVRTRTRQCNNPAPSRGGKPCDGPKTQEEHCMLSVFAEKSAECVNDEDGQKEIDKEVTKPESGCLIPEPIENGFFEPEKKQYKVAEEVELICDSGFELEGFQFLRCLPDGTWKKEAKWALYPIISASSVSSTLNQQVLMIAIATNEKQLPIISRELLEFQQTLRKLNKKRN